MSPADSPFAQLPAPGPHPATAELRAYAAGTLTPADEHRIEAHTLDCERCADLLEGFSMTDAATTDQAVAELRTRLQARIGSPEAEPAVPGWAWSRIAAAAALVGVVCGGIWGWEQRDTAPKAEVVRLETTAPARPAATAAPRQATEPATATADVASASSATAMAESEAPNASQAAPTAEPKARQHEYAAVAPSRAARRYSAPPAPAPAAPAADYTVLADAEPSPTNSAVVEEITEAKKPVVASRQPTSLSEAAIAGVEISAPAKKMAMRAAAKNEATPATGAMADSIAADRKDVPASSFTKAKTAINSLAAGNAAAASVPNTPMPAALAINPIPVGGTSALRDYIRRQAAEFEPEEGATRIQGVVRLKFIVGADGKVSNLKVVRGMRADYDEEALRIVCEGPAWQPGIAGGRRAPLPIELTVTF